MPSRSLSNRVITQIAHAEAREQDVHFRDDYRQALLTMAYARDGSPMPFVEASYKMYGLHPDKVWPKIVAHRQAMIGQPINFQAFQFARKIRNQEAQRADVVEASKGKGARSELLVMAAPIEPRPDPGRTGAATAHDPAERRKLGNG